MRRHAAILAVFAIKPNDLIDRRYLNDFAKSGFFDRVWEGKR